MSSGDRPSVREPHALTPSSIVAPAGARLAAAIETVTPELEADWQRLCARTGASPFLEPFWFRAWLAAFDSGELRLATVRREGTLAAALPLLVERRVARAPANWHTPRFGPVSDSPTATRALAELLVRAVGRRLDVTMLAATGDLARELPRAAAAGRLRTIVRTVARQPYVDLSNGWDGVQAALPGKLRKEARRLHRRLDEQGDVELVVHEGGESLDSLLAAGFALERSGWKGERGTAIVSRRDTREFYTGVAHSAAERDMLRLAFLRVDGRPIAFDLCLEGGGCLYALKGGFDTAFRRFGPGSVLAWESLRWACERGLSSYEFLGDADRYKLAWTDATRERVRVQVFGRSPAGRVEHLAWGRGRDLAKRVLSRTLDRR